MFPPSALRETIILIIFGVVLVPIAAKRAQDAPGYWQTFSKELSSLSYDVADRTWGADLAMLRIDEHHDDDTTLATGQLYNSKVGRLQMVDTIGIAYRANVVLKPNETIPMVYPTRSAPQADTRAALTIHFHIASAGETTEAPTTTAGSCEMPQATPPPSSSSSTTGQESAAAETPVAKASEATKGRWTLIWMGSAITAVAMFMACC